jgi:hypothetical protein
LVQCSSIREVDAFKCGLDLPLDLFLYFFHKIDILFGLDSLVFLVKDLNLLNLMFVEFDLSLKMCILFPEVLNFLDYSFNLNLILFGGNLVIDHVELFLKVFNCLIGFVGIFLLNLQFLLKLQLGIEKFFADLDKRSLILLDSFFLLAFGVIQ